jgi:DNA polymerase-3 subunit delta
MKNIQKELANIKKGNVASVYLVLGTERYYSERIREALMDNVLEEEAFDYNFSSFDMEQRSISDALFEAMSFPFFGDRRLILVENPFFLTGKKVKSAPEHNLDELMDYLENPAEFSVVVIFAPYEKLDRRKKVTKQLEKKAKVIDVSAPKPHEAAQYIKELVKEWGYHFSPEAYQLFTERTNGDLSKMMHELDKIFLYHLDTKNITKESVQQLVPKTLEQNVFELNNLVLSNNVQGSMEAYHDLLIQKEEPIMINSLLISQFRILLQVKILSKQGYSEGDIVKVLKAHPYRIKVTLRDVHKYKQELLSEALDYLIEADYKMKTGQVDQQLQIELFIMRFSQQSKIHA